MTNIVKLVHTNKEHINAVAFLHQTLLPESIVSKFGKLFLKKFYYYSLVKDGLIDVYLYHRNDAYVGFIVCTNAPFTFTKIGMKQNFFRLCWVLGISVLLKPSRLLLLLNMNGDIDFKPLQTPEYKGIGQFMSFGVLEAHRKHIDENFNITIPNVLMKQVFTHFLNVNKEKFFLLVLKSNLNAIAFYKKYNGVTLNVDNNSQSNIVTFLTHK